MALKVKTINLASLGISLATVAGCFGVMVVLNNEPLSITSIGASLIVGLITYAVSRFFIWKYVVSRIKPVYQMILGQKMSAQDIERRFSDSDIVNNVGTDLSQWVEKSSEEINRLKELETYRKEFLGNVSHEMKTPLFTLQGYILTLIDGGIYDTEVNMKYLQKAEKSIDRLTAIVKDLEEISKLEMKVLYLDREQFDIVALVKECVEYISPKARDRNITIKVASSLPIDVFADKVRIEQVLVNLLSNSVKYGRDGGVTTVRFEDMFDKVMIEVEDNGIGISKEDLPRVFERFFRADKSRSSREEGGTGLGLAIVKHIVEAHGDKISVRSADKSTVFSFTLNKYL